MWGRSGFFPGFRGETPPLNSDFDSIDIPADGALCGDPRDEWPYGPKGKYMCSLSWALTLGLGVVAAGVACSPGPEPDETVPVVDCAAVEIPSYSALEILPSCTNCHATTLTGANRQGAPPEFDYDTYEVAAYTAMPAAIEVHAGAMPFTGVVTEEEKEDFYAWALCGTPE